MSRNLTDRNLFLMVYKTTIYLTHRLLHAGERLVTPMLDPGTETPQGISQETEEYLKDTARTMTFFAIRVWVIKQQMDAMFKG